MRRERCICWDWRAGGCIKPIRHWANCTNWVKARSGTFGARTSRPADICLVILGRALLSWGWQQARIASNPCTTILLTAMVSSLVPRGWGFGPRESFSGEKTLRLMTPIQQGGCIAETLGRSLYPNGCSSDGLGVVRSSAPVSVTCRSSSRRMPNSPRI